MVYLHVPFCRSFCSYCAFYSELFQSSLAQEYTHSVLDEIAQRKEEIEQTLSLNTLYIGGGTPSVLPPVFLSQIVKTLADVTGGRYTEFTVEVNPDDITQEYVAFLRSLGVTRVSMGVQSFDDALLRKIARRHDAQTARRAYTLLREGGFENISLDLIFGFGWWREDAALALRGGAAARDAAHRAGASVERDVQRLLNLPGGPPEHISAYQLSIEEGSALEEQVRRGLYQEADEASCEQSYLRLCALLREAGYEHYEISNFAKSGREAVHNSAYWSGHSYVGLGPAAHSYDGQTRRWNSTEPAVCAAERCGRWYAQGEVLDEEKRQLEHLMLGLRTSTGVERSFLEDIASRERVKNLQSRGDLVATPTEGYLRIPEEKWFVSDFIIKDLL